MVQALEHTIDGRQLSWQAFARRLESCRPAVERGGLHIRVVAPRGCEAEAQRLINALALGDQVTLAEPGATRPAIQKRTSPLEWIVSALLGPAALQRHIRTPPTIGSNPSLAE